mmetsp:Transcript_26367/g.81027  ORF Transcript_26367/g.81027 Transcript_26367/m.81027 type:complete len:468 (-) Transcript_26367:241-1644(-)
MLLSLCRPGPPSDDEASSPFCVEFACRPRLDESAPEGAWLSGMQEEPCSLRPGEWPPWQGMGPRLPPPPRPAVASDDGISEGDEDLELAACTAEEFDAFGFALAPPGDALGESARSYARWFEPKADRRRRRFEARRGRLKEPGAWARVPRVLLKRLLRKGVPAEHRAEVWWSVLGCDERRNSSAMSYTDFLNDDLSMKTTEEIERDLPRTFPRHGTFRAAAGRARLRDVLRAFASCKPSVRYCQGLNFIAALLLIVFLDEERAFWALVGAVECLGVEGYYTEGMTLLRADVQVMASLMAQKCPRVARVFQAHDVQLTSICSEWLITWFAKCLPPETALRVWDTLFLEGFKVLFRISLGIFKRAEAEALRCTSFDDIMLNAKHWPRRMVEHNELLKASFNGVPGLRRRDLLQARAAALTQVEAEDEERRRRVQKSYEHQSREAAAREASRRCEALGDGLVVAGKCSSL